MGLFTDECYGELGLGAPELIFTSIAVEFLLPTIKVGLKERKHFRKSKKRKNITGNIFNGIDRK